MADLRAVRNRGVVLLLIVALAAIWFLRLAFRLTGAALALVAVAIVILAGLGWVSSRIHGDGRR